MNLLTPEEVAGILKIKPRQFKERVQFRKDFPRPIMLGDRLKRWNLDDLNDWVVRHTAPR